MAVVLMMLALIVCPILFFGILYWLGTRNKNEISINVSPLPFWATIKKSYQLAWLYRWEYIKISWCWLALAIPVMFAVNWFNISLDGTSCLEPKEATKYLMLHTPRTLLFSLLVEIIKIFFGVSIAVAWHRLILRNEQVTKDYYLRFDKVVWNYFILAALITCITLLPNFIDLFIFGLSSNYIGLLHFVAFVTAIAVIIFTVRISILLPARALGFDIPIKEGWKKSELNFWRLFGGSFFCAFPILLVSLFVSFIVLFLIPIHIATGNCGHEIAQSIETTYNTLLYMLFVAPIYLSFLSLSYQHFFESDEVNAA